MSDPKDKDLLDRVLELIERESTRDLATALMDDVCGYSFYVMHRTLGEVYHSKQKDLDSLSVEYLDVIARLKKTYAS